MGPNEVATAGRLIRKARRRREWSQAELARRAGIPASQLCAYERAAKQPSVAVLAKILGAAGMSLDIADPVSESRRQAQELMDVLGLVDAMPARDRGTSRPPALFKDLILR